MAPEIYAASPKPCIRAASGSSPGASSHRAETSDGQIDVQSRRHPAFAQRESSTVARIYDCTGHRQGYLASSNSVVRSLVERGLARPDPLRIGLDVTGDCEIIAATAPCRAKILAIGPLTRGTFFEIDAIPDIRVQCKALASSLLS